MPEEEKGSTRRKEDLPEPKETPERKEKAEPASPPGPTTTAAKGKASGAASEGGAAPSEPTQKEKEETEELPAPRRPELDPESRRLLAVRGNANRRRPRFVRQQSHRYLRIARRGSWRAPKGVQSKQRRHYGYRPTVVSVGFRGPRKVRGRTPVGFVPVLVHTTRDLDGVEPAREIAVIAGGVGTRQRLILEQAARQRGIRVANPVLREEREE